MLWRPPFGPFRSARSVTCPATPSNNLGGGEAVEHGIVYELTIAVACILALFFGVRWLMQRWFERRK